MKFDRNVFHVKLRLIVPAAHVELAPVDMDVDMDGKFRIHGKPAFSRFLRNFAIAKRCTDEKI